MPTPPVEDVFGIVGTTQAGSFYVERVVAEGGFGVVYKALHSGFRAPVALKCLKVPEQMSSRQREVFLEKFREEAELMFRLSASIPEVTRPLNIDQLKLDGRFVPFLALEWLEGESLDGIISKRKKAGQAPMSLHKLVKLLKPVANALSRAHRFPGPNGKISVVHRDLKPENVFITNIGGVEGVKILDFGIAKAKKVASVAAGRVTGKVSDDDYNAFTPAYGAPEQWAPKKYGDTGTWTDVWGLALTMVEALVGEPVIDGEAYAMRATVMDEKKRPTPRAFGVVIASEVDEVFQKAMACDPKERYQKIDDFWGELEKAMGIAQPRFRDARRELSDEEEREMSRRPPSLPPPMEVSPSSRPRPVDPAASKSGDAAFKSGDVAWKSGDVPLKGDVAARMEAAKAAAEHDLPIVGASAKAPSVPELDAPFAQGVVRGTPARGVPAKGSDGALAMDLEAELASSPASPTSSGVNAKVPAAASSGMFKRPPPALADAAPPPFEADLDLPPSSVRSNQPRSPKAGAAPPSSDRERDERSPAPVPIALASPPSHEAAAVSARYAPAPARVSSRPSGAHRESTELGHLRDRLRVPLVIVFVAAAISMIDLMVTRSTGQLLMIGPLRPFWIAGPLALAGVGLIVWRLLGERDDG